MRRATFASALFTALLTLTVVAPPVAAESWELAPPFERTGTGYIGFGVATASPDGTLTASATLGGTAWYDSEAHGWAGDTVTWTPPSKPATYYDTRTLSATATIEIVDVKLLGPGSMAWVGVSADTRWGSPGCSQVVTMGDVGKVLTVSCTLEYMTSGDLVAGLAAVHVIDRNLGGWVSTGYSTASVRASVKQLVIRG